LGSLQKTVFTNNGKDKVTFTFEIGKMIEIKIGKVGIKLVKKRVPFAKLIQLRT